MSGSGSMRICGFGLGGLMRDGGDDALDQFAGVDLAPAGIRAGPRG